MNARMKALSGTMLKALSAAQQDALVEMWEVDFRALGGEVFRFCNQVNELNQAVVWKGQEYTPYPISAEGFETTSQGAGNRPTLTVSNLLGFVTGAADQYNQLVGVDVVRRLTYAKFLDAANFKDGNPTADPNQEIIGKYVIEQMTSLTAERAVFELAAPSESDGSVIPSRIMMANTCIWQYRGEGCGYAGRAVADRLDMPTDDIKKDACSGTLTGCRARFGATAVLPFGGFPSADKVGGA